MLAPYLIGVITAPLVAQVVKPVLRSAVKACVGVALEVHKAVAELGEEIQVDATELISKKRVGQKGTQ